MITPALTNGCSPSIVRPGLHVPAVFWKLIIFSPFSKTTISLPGFALPVVQRNGNSVPYWAWSVWCMTTSYSKSTQNDKPAIWKEYSPWTVFESLGFWCPKAPFTDEVWAGRALIFHMFRLKVSINTFPPTGISSDDPCFSLSPLYLARFNSFAILLAKCERHSRLDMLYRRVVKWFLNLFITISFSTFAYF